MASASSWGRLHMGQWPVGRSIAVKLVRCATALNIGLPAAASSRTWTLGMEQQINVVSTSWRALLDSATRARATCAGSGTARARNRSRCSLLRPSKLACLPRVSKSGSGSSAVSSGRSGAKDLHRSWDRSPPRRSDGPTLGACLQLGSPARSRHCVPPGPHRRPSRPGWLRWRQLGRRACA